MKKWHNIILGIIVCLGIILRFWQLGVVPGGLEWDEVAIGYDSYSLLHTGRDQFGTWFPITFRSLDDYKPPLYNYFAIPPIAIFGLTPFAVRFPSALFGSLSIFGVYLLTKELFRSQLKEHEVTLLALLATFFMAISPWHLQFSRAAFEVNLSLTFIIFGVYAVLRAVRETKWLSIASICFGLGLFSYHSSRVVIPLLILSLVILLHKKLMIQRKKLIQPLVIFALFFIAFLPIALSKEAQIRFTVTNFLNPAFPYGDEVDYKAQSAQLIEQDQKTGDHIWGRIFHNRRIAFINYDNVIKVAGNWLSHYSFPFLFVHADMPLHHAPGFGLLYIWDMPFLILGLIFFLRFFADRFSLPILWWLIIAPIPASITRQAPHAVRTELLVPALHIFCALGVFVTFRYLWKNERLLGVFVGGIVSLLLLFNIGYYLHQYYVHTPYEVADKWFANRKEIALYTDSVKNDYTKVIVSTRLEQPHVFWLFYLKYDPWKYLSEGGTASGGWAEDRNHFDKYEFKPIDFNAMKKEGKSLFVGLPSEFPSDIQTVKTFYYPNGSPAIKVVQS